jgi:hypothetical protein
MNKPNTTNATPATTIASNSVEIAIDGDDGPNAAVLGCNDKPAMAVWGGVLVPDKELRDWSASNPKG